MKQINIIGSMSTILALGFVVYVNYQQGNISKKKVERNIEPISQPVDMETDSISSIIDSMQHIKQADIYMDSVNMDCNGY